MPWYGVGFERSSPVRPVTSAAGRSTVQETVFEPSGLSFVLVGVAE